MARARSIRGAARVPVKVTGGALWIGWHGREQLLYPEAARYLRKIGVPSGKWTDVWVDWAPVQRSKR